MRILAQELRGAGWGTKLAEVYEIHLHRKSQETAPSMVLVGMDDEVCKAAILKFDGFLEATQWLTQPATALHGRIPFHVAATTEGRAEVLAALKRMSP